MCECQEYKFKLKLGVGCVCGPGRTERLHLQHVLSEAHLAFGPSPHGPQQVILRAAGEAARIWVQQEVQIAAVCHHPRHDSRIRVDRDIDRKVGHDERCGVHRTSGACRVDGEDAEAGEVEDPRLVALGRVEALHELFAQGTREPAVARVVGKLRDAVRVEEHVDVVTFKRMRAGRARALLPVAQRGVRVGIDRGRRPEDEKEEGHDGLRAGLHV